MRKQKPSMKGSNQIVSKLLRPKQPENKPSGPKKAKGPIVLEARRCLCRAFEEWYKWGMLVIGNPHVAPLSGLVLAWHGRKMSNRACIKFVLRLTAESHDLSQPVDLKDHCARHGTNNFVTIKLVLYSMNYLHLARHHSP
ncbi:hypothetical protein E1A91_A08G169600v1 [Gossypium mustelinum]|uniref:GAGA-binding transcriptional activator n=3 Tax=Gossypium TaxID=3633 RepID=A0A5D2Y9N7_GOSMU|nr:hypothetical protein ES288_A08G178800v1 [Gossypium darwinii]TYI15346.1 hypothetical protein ES332_A08G179600v1 [Gossypium tomentosum]TYJ23117.1 hypothetical protein E1A91_A08G169600v1 [Gossypium mustelinum]